MLVLKGKGIFLREFKVSDISADYIKWMNDPEVNKYLNSRHVKQTAGGIKKYVRSFYGKTNKMLFGIFLKENGLHIGNISFSEIDKINGYGIIGICIGKKECWGKGYGVEAVKLLVKFGEQKLKLRRSEAVAYAVNKGSVKTFIRAGFKFEGVFKRKYIFNGRRVDGILFGKTLN